MPKHGACGLCSINLSEYVINPFTENAQIDYASLKEDLFYVVEAMDDIINENLPFHALQEQRDVATKFRNLGIGVMGIHDMLIKMGIVYGSDESIRVVRELMHFVFKNAILSSSKLAGERGRFPGYDPAILDSSIFNKIKWETTEIAEIKEKGLRNSTLLSIAPTGSIGTMLNISTGIEPWFAFSYFRNTKSLGNKEESYEVWAPIAEEAKKHRYEHTLVTSKDITWKQHIDMQAAAQEFVDTAISKTINMPKETTPEEVEQVYLYAWERGLKGCTIYVEGSRDPILSNEKISEPNPSNKFVSTRAPKRPVELEADFYTIKYKGEQFTVVVGLMENKPYEIFAYQNNIELNLKDHRGKIIKVSNNHYKYVSEYLTIKNLLLEFNNVEEKTATLYPSQLLRHGVEIKYIIKTMKKVDGNIASFTAAICRVLAKYTTKEVTKETCPECGEKLIMEQGCCKCPSCGYSRCG